MSRTESQVEMKHRTDEEIVQRHRNGDVDSFRELLRRCLELDRPSEVIQWLADDELAELYRLGLNAAMDELVLRYEQRVRRFVLAQFGGGNRQDAEDIVQKAWVRIMKAIRDGKYDPRGQFSPWFFRICRNLMLDEVKQRKRRIKLTATQLDDGTGPEIDTPDERPTPDQDAMNRELVDAIDAALAQMELHYQLIFRLRNYCGLTLKIVAALTGFTIERVRQIERKVIEQLTPILREYTPSPD